MARLAQAEELKVVVLASEGEYTQEWKETVLMVTSPEGIALSLEISLWTLA